MKNFLGVDKTPPALERSFKAATELKGELPIDLEMGGIPLEELSSLVEDIHVKTREESKKLRCQKDTKKIPKSWKKQKMIPLILMNMGSYTGIARRLLWEVLLVQF